MTDAETLAGGGTRIHRDPPISAGTAVARAPPIVGGPNDARRPGGAASGAGASEATVTAGPARCGRALAAGARTIVGARPRGTGRAAVAAARAGGATTRHPPDGAATCPLHGGSGSPRLGGTGGIEIGPRTGGQTGPSRRTRPRLLANALRLSVAQTGCWHGRRRLCTETLPQWSAGQAPTGQIEGSRRCGQRSRGGIVPPPRPGMLPPRTPCSCPRCRAPRMKRRRAPLPRAPDLCGNGGPMQQPTLGTPGIRVRRCPGRLRRSSPRPPLVWTTA